MKALSVLLIGVALAATELSAQNPPVAPPAGQRGAATPPGAPPAGQRGGGGGRGRGAVQVMTLATTGWTDGGAIPIKYAQPGHEVSPPLTWTNPPDTVQSFVLIVHDLDAPNGNATDDALHWLVWNIPGASRGLPEHVPQGPEQPDGMRQISGTGPYYRGAAAPSTGPAHHYVFELYALDSMVDVKPVGATPAETRAAVMAAMAGHLRGKATLIGTFRRAAP